MVMICKLDKACCCLSLSQGCLLLGLLDLATNIYLTVDYSILVHKTPNIKDISMLVGAVIGVCTCSLMIYGSMTKYHRLLIPHIVWESFLIGLFAVGGLALIFYDFLSGNVLSALMLAAIMCCVLPLCTYYWNVMHNRYLEIKETQSAPPDLIEMQ